MFHRDVAVLSGVANVLRMRAFDVRELPLQRFDNIFGFVQAQGGLGEVRTPIGARDGQSLYLGGRSDDLGNRWGLASRADDFVVIAMADQYERVAFFGKLNRFNVNLGDQRAGGIDHAQPALFAGTAHFGRDAVGAVNHALAGRNFIHRVNKNGAFALQFFHHETVVHDLFADVDRRAEGLKGDADDVDGSHYAGAKAARLEQQKAFLAFRHLISRWLKDTLFPR